MSIGKNKNRWRSGKSRGCFCYGLKTARTNEASSPFCYSLLPWELTTRRVLTAIFGYVIFLPTTLEVVPIPQRGEWKPRETVITPDDTARRKQSQGSNPAPSDPGATLQHSLMWPPAPESVFQPTVPAFAPLLAFTSQGWLSAPFH